MAIRLSESAARRSPASLKRFGPGPRRPGKTYNRGLGTVAERWDVFCRVVDNFGDVGVSWRLARQLAREHGKRVRLWLDDVSVLGTLRPEIDATLAAQDLEGVEVRHMRQDFAESDVADVVVETFGCDPPERYVLAMAERKPRARWINLEYLSAENWVEGSHALPSPHPRLAITKHYFFPGFTARTGGLLRERDLLERRAAFQASPDALGAFWRSLTGAVPPGGALKVSLFAYEEAPIHRLLEACAGVDLPVWFVAPEGVAAQALEACQPRTSPDREHPVEAFVVPFLPQDRYDELLWACDVNFVRGEDSFVRAQWAARPFVWHIYPQKEGAHWVKLSAFLSRYTAGLDRRHAGLVTALWEAWNRPERPDLGESPQPRLEEAWPAYVAQRAALADHARRWCEGLATRQDLAAALVDFADKVL